MNQRTSRGLPLRLPPRPSASPAPQRAGARLPRRGSDGRLPGNQRRRRRCQRRPPGRSAASARRAARASSGRRRSGGRRSGRQRRRGKSAAPEQSSPAAVAPRKATAGRRRRRGDRPRGGRKAGRLPRWRRRRLGAHRGSRGGRRRAAPRSAVQSLDRRGPFRGGVRVLITGPPGLRKDSCVRGDEARRSLPSPAHGCGKSAGAAPRAARESSRRRRPRAGGFLRKAALKRPAAGRAQGGQVAAPAMAKAPAVSAQAAATK